jgi:hypothetical protein
MLAVRPGATGSRIAVPGSTDETTAVFATYEPDSGDPQPDAAERSKASASIGAGAACAGGGTSRLRRSANRAAIAAIAVRERGEAEERALSAIRERCPSVIVVIRARRADRSESDPLKLAPAYPENAPEITIM